MVVIRNPDGTITLQPTVDENAVIDYMYAQRGSNVLKIFLEEHLFQRGHQRDFEAANQFQTVLATVHEDDRAAVIATAISNAKSAKKKVKHG